MRFLPTYCYDYGKIAETPRTPRADKKKPTQPGLMSLAARAAKGGGGNDDDEEEDDEDDQHRAEFDHSKTPSYRNRILMRTRDGFDCYPLGLFGGYESFFFFFSLHFIVPSFCFIVCFLPFLLVTLFFTPLSAFFLSHC